MSQTVLDGSAAFGLDIRPVAGQLGAEVVGIRLFPDLPEDTIEAVRQALHRHRVLFFRSQHHLDDAAQEGFARRFGELVAHPTNPALAGTSILELDASKGGGRADQWHTDVTFVDAYPKASILRAVVVPNYGGDTIWADTVAAYRALSPELKALAEKLWALHSNAYDYAAVRPNATALDRAHYEKHFRSTVFETEHPVVRVHPETGERSLVLGYFIQRLIGQTIGNSRTLFDLLQSHVTRPENTVRWRWQAGDVAFWDNQATQHYAVNDYGEQPRVMRRVTLAGDVPVSIDGLRSKARSQAKAA